MKRLTLATLFLALGACDVSQELQGAGLAEGGATDPPGTDASAGPRPPLPAGDSGRADGAATDAPCAPTESGCPVISRIEPAGIDVPTGSLLTIVGQRLAPDNSRTVVLLDDVVVDNAFNLGFNQESTDSRLIFPVPNRFVGPTLVTVRVRVGTATSNALTVRIVPKVESQGGNVVVTGPANDGLGTIVPGRPTPYVLRWTVASLTNLPATYHFTPSVTNVVGATEAQWRSGITLSETGPIQLQPYQARIVAMNVLVPVGATSAYVSLRAASADQSLDSAGSPIAFVAGSVPEISEPRAVVNVRTIPPNFGGAPNPIAHRRVDGLRGLAMQPNAVAEIPMELSFPGNDPTAVGDYRFRVRVEGETGRWTVGTLVPTGGAGVLGNAPRFRVPITSSAVADTSTTSHIVVYAEKFVGDAAQPVLSSFVRIPIVGRK
jgi:hypothetical protein